MRTNHWMRTALLAGGLLAVALLASRMPQPAQAADASSQLKQALDHLNRAESALQRAPDDRSGRRDRARGYVAQAVAEVRAGLAGETPR